MENVIAKGYLETNKRIKGIPTKRLYGVSFGMLLLFLALLLIGILPSVFLASHRQYIEVRGWQKELELPPMEGLNEMEFSGLGEMEMLEMRELHRAYEGVRYGPTE